MLSECSSTTRVMSTQKKDIFFGLDLWLGGNSSIHCIDWSKGNRSSRTSCSSFWWRMPHQCAVRACVYLFIDTRSACAQMPFFFALVHIHPGRKTAGLQRRKLSMFSNIIPTKVLCRIPAARIIQARYPERQNALIYCNQPSLLSATLA